MMRSNGSFSFTPQWRAAALWLLYALIIAGSIYRAAYVVGHNPVDFIGTDMERHWTNGAEDPLRDDPFTMGDPILYQLYVGALAKLTLKIPALLAFYTILLSLLMPWVWYRFFRELQQSRLAAVAGWAVIIWLPSWNSIYGYFMTETLLLPMLGAALWATWRCRRKQTVHSFVLMVLLWTLAGLTRGIAIPMAAVAATWVWYGQRHRFKKACYGIALLGLILGPLAYRGYEKVHMFAPHGIGTLAKVYGRSGKLEINLEYRREGAIWYFGFVSPSMGSEPFEPLSHWQTRREGLVKVFIDVDKGDADWHATLRENALTFERYLWIVQENLIFLFFGESWPDSDRFLLLGELNYQMRWVWFPLMLGVLIATVVCWRKRRGDLLLPALILVWFTVQGMMIISVNEGRYRKPLEGLLIAQVILLAGTCRRKREEEPLENRRQGDRRRGPDRRQGMADRRAGPG